MDKTISLEGIDKKVLKALMSETLTKDEKFEILLDSIMEEAPPTADREIVREILKDI